MEMTPLIASFLLLIAGGEKPADAIELAVISTSPAKMLQDNYYNTELTFARHSVYSFMHPEVNPRIKTGARLLQTWYLNFESLESGELQKIEEYLDNMDRYFHE